MSNFTLTNRPTTKNILLVANWDSNVGYAWWLMENFWSTIANEFIKTNHHCVLIYPTISTIPDIIQKSPIEVFRHDFDDKSLKNIFKILNLIRHKNIGYVYLSDKPETSLYYLLLKISGVRKILIHDHTPGDRPPVSGLKKTVKKLFKRIPFITADIFIAVTEYIKARMLNSSCLPPEKCRVAKNGIIPISRDPAYRYYAHDQFAIPHDATIIITTGRAHFYKRIDFILEAFAKCTQNNPQLSVFLIYCGDGPHLQNFKDLARKLDIDKLVIFAGNRNDVRLLLQSCDIGVQASQGEVGYSLSILEYMSAGLATLVPDNPSVCQAITNNHNGIIFNQDNPSDLSEKLKQLVEDKILRNRIGENAEITVVTDYSLATTNRELIEIFSSAIK